MSAVIESMRERMPWQAVGRMILVREGVNVGRGWDNTIEKLAESKVQLPEGKLEDALEEHNLCGEKFVKLYRVDDEDRLALQEKIKLLEVVENGFSSAYPKSVPSDAINDLSGVPKLVDVVQNDDGVGAVYAHATRLTTRVHIDLDQILEDPSALEALYDEVVGLKYRNVQLFSVIWVPHNFPYVEIRSDLPAGMTMDLVHGIQKQIRLICNELGAVELVDPIDLFPVLDAVYDADGEGTVVELSFTTTSASVKNEKMRRSGLDLRKEPYHIHGKKGLGTPIEPFRMFVRWKVPLGDNVVSAPEMGLIGTSRGRSTVGLPGAVGMSGAVVRNCVGLADYGRVLEVIHKYLGQST